VLSLGDYETLIIAIWGAVLGTLSFVWQVISYVIERRPKIEVSISFGTMDILSALQDVIVLEAVNRGSVKVSFSSLPTFLLSNGTVKEEQQLITRSLFGANFPYDLEPRKNVPLYILMSKLVESLKAKGFSGRIKLTGLFVDALGNRYKSEPLDLDIDYWSEKLKIKESQS